jgi:hypothetical protein
MLSVDPEADANESSVVGGQGGDHAEKNVQTKIISIGLVREE